MTHGFISRLRKSGSLKYVAVFMAVMLLNSMLYPLRTFALTGGPVQSEYESGYSSGSTDMVDPFTGDFKYGMNLLTIPGMDGGFPINLDYNAGITMDQEASWVGLGWSLNVGAINRSMRGMPDDFSGEEEYTRESNMKPHWIIGVDFQGIKTGGIPTEAFGIPVDGFNAGGGIYYDSYSGIGINVDAGLYGPLVGNLGFDASISYDPNTGYSPDFGLQYPLAKINGVNYGLGMNISLNSYEGLTALNGSAYCKSGNDSKNMFSVSLPLRQNYPPAIETPMTGTSVGFKVKVGNETAPGISTAKVVKGYYSEFAIAKKDQERSYKVLGYMYDEPHNPLHNYQRDLSYGRSYAQSKELSFVPMPNHTYDIYSASAVGLGLNFRSKRSDIPVLSPVKVKTQTSDMQMGIEFSASTSISTHFGGNFSGMDMYGSSGHWLGGDDLLQDYAKNNYVAKKTGYRSSYYISTAETGVGKHNEDARIGNDKCIGLRLVPYFHTALTTGSFYTIRAKALCNYSGGKLEDNYREYRDQVSQNIEYFTNSELNNYGLGVQDNLYSSGQYPCESLSTAYSYNYNSRPENQIGLYSILNTDGSRYEFGLPVYNNKQVDAVFSVDHQANDKVKTVDYLDVDASVDNNNGDDNLFMKNTMPAYASSYLLTSVVSSDYIDIKGDGPTPDDFGNYVKVNYSKTSSNYKWRIPFTDANYSPGYYSKDGDDKATYMYGEKELYYINSIETKTHIAVFYVSDREDARGVDLENNAGMDANNIPQKLDSIALFSKTCDNYGNLALMIPEKTVHFTYSYSLCEGIPNRVSGIDETGKLTLTSVYYTYKKNKKGAQSPYTFDYNQSTENPDYSMGQTDRWGTYQPERVIGTNPGNTVTSVDNPYTNQLSSYSDRNTNAGVWNLKTINLPSGASIEITYEPDDYGYVQDKPAMEMARIIATGDANGVVDGITDFGRVDKNTRRIYFELDNSNTTADSIFNYVLAQDELYFKAFMDLMDRSEYGLDEAYDYVEGYAKVSKDAGSWGVVDYGGVHCGFITLEAVPVHENSGNTHPFSKAAWQYMYYSRPELLNPSLSHNGFIGELITQFIALYQNTFQTLMGLYTTCHINQYASKMLLSTNNSKYRPSFVRIPTIDGIKYGGGHRVSKIMYHDNWNDVSAGQSSDYGQSFEYRLPDGRSSGVASYEPLAGGDENACRYRLETYSGDKKKEYRMFNVEKPLTEDYYPSPVVGYSQVVVSNITPAGIEFKKSGAGITRYDFYTAKDFPVTEEFTDIAKLRNKQTVFIPFIGSKKYNNNAFSQGYLITLNNMHGKLEALSTYKTNDNPYDPTIEPISKTSYIYKTQSPYNPNGANVLNNIVQVQFPDGTLSTEEMGVERDLFVSDNENHTVVESEGIQINLEVAPPVFVPFLLPDVFFDESTVQILSTMKVIQRNGILDKVVSKGEGQRSEVQNLVYDAATGDPVLSQALNEFGEPVFTYNYMAHSYYPGMESANDNYRLSIGGLSMASGGDVGLSSTQLSFYTPGDEIFAQYGTPPTYEKLWVNSVGTNSINLIDETGQTTSATGLNITTVRSGKRNMTGLGCGSIVTLGNPLSQSISNPLFDAINYALSSYGGLYVFCDNKMPSYCWNGVTLSYTDCSGNEVSYGVNTDNLPIVRIGINDADKCSATIVFAANNFSSTEKITAIDFYDDHLIGHFIDGTTTREIIGVWNDPQHCFEQCMVGVLHAQSTEFSDNWTFNYADINDPDVNGQPLSSRSVQNPYRYGAKGRWFNKSSHTFLVNRVHESSSQNDISDDGEYAYFSIYDWVSGTNSDEWRKNSEMSRYSPFGWALENQDILNNKNSALYGHYIEGARDIAVAAASNCSYFEMAFDGFEDYAGGNYVFNKGHGHLNFKMGSDGDAPILNPDYAHTGGYSLQISYGADVSYTTVSSPTENNNPYFMPEPPATGTKKYVFSAWVNITGNHAYSAVATIKYNGSTIKTITLPNTGDQIDGWRRMYGEFEIPAGTFASFQVILSSGTRTYFDDIRIHPFNSSMKTMVFDAKTMQLKAELDDQNFATIYVYNNEGGIMNVLRETAKGRTSVGSMWKNVRQSY
ncbi:MAG: hypothetical protein A2W93_09700 [Bacteroidetes bacterium GWF2_43_63]|nr:MAG: hypothetical protein A2W94_07185 [Bacteroidetes bacterium GWE2_42_42]OFY54580.1 MAG: hypothetical protein A2W93_09700 [Bacteroidetes bacterium GWF2_43_63]HBG70609.1 hypothetical protein [Bacteroidales bacterium]HCB60906.1 hypothetical protein [Bacteroidales bacterium]